MITRDLIVVLVLGGLCGLLACVHVSLIVGLLSRTPRWRGLVALVLPVAAPIVGAQAGLVLRAVGWVVLVIAYLVIRARFLTLNG